MADKEQNKVIDWGSPLGFCIAFLTIGFGIFSLSLDNPFDPVNDFTQFINIPSFAIVLGGTLAALIISLPLDALAGIPSVIAQAFQLNTFSYMDTINQILKWAEKGRKDGLLSLDNEIQTLPEGFLKKGMETAIIERDATKVKVFMLTEINNISARHRAAQDFFTKGEKFAPAFGMMGTVMGLVDMMNGFGAGGDGGGGGDLMQTMTGLLSGMGTALITTFYGVVLANFFFGPIAGKLQRLTSVELRHKNVITEGVMSIHAREHPIIIRDKLMMFVPSAIRLSSSKAANKK